MINVGAYHDIPEEEMFVFIYDSNVFLFTLRMSNVNETTKAWDFIKYVTLKDMQKIDDNQLMQMFKKALSMYKYNGLPDSYKQQFRMNINF